MALPILVGLFALLSACATPTGRAPGDGATEAVPLALVARYPDADATHVPTNVSILVRFNRALDPASVSDASISIPGLSGRVSVDGRTIVFRPSQTLSKNTTYTVTLAPTLRAIMGEPWATTPETWRFATSSQALAEPTAMHLPTASGKTELFRYPYLQTDNSRRMKILWATLNPGKGLVQYKADHEPLWQVVPAESQKYEAARTRLKHDFHQHETFLEGLTPGAHYRYRIVHDGTVLADNVPFKALEDGQNADVRFIAFGDFGTQYKTPRAVRDAIVSRNAAGELRYPHDFIVGVGDIAYYRGSFEDFDQRFFNQMSGKGDRGDGEHSLLARRPFVPVLGNHEYPGQDENALPEGFLQSFSNPVTDDIPRGGEERYYSFDAGNAHFVVLDSMKFQGYPGGALDDMLEWLDHDLARTQKKWRIVFFHHAIFAHGPHGTYGDIRQNRGMRQRLAPIMQKHGVQLAVNGHDHLYERTKRMRVDSSGMIIRDRGCSVTESDKGIVYLTVGIGGHDLHNRRIEPAPCGSPTYEEGMSDYGEGYDFVAFRNGHPVLYDDSDREPKLPVLRHGFAHVTVGPEALRVVVYNYAGEVLDDFELR